MSGTQRREQQEVAVLEAARAQFTVAVVVRPVRAFLTHTPLFAVVVVWRRLVLDVTDLTAKATTDERRADGRCFAQVRRAGVQALCRTDVALFACQHSQITYVGRTSQC